MTQEPYDTIIIGAGPAGLTAGIYAARIGLKTLMLDGKLPGGRALVVPMIENFPGFPDGITGEELMHKIVKQAKKFGAEIRFPGEVVDIDLSGKVKLVKTNVVYPTRALILSTGTQRKKLQVPGEMEYLGQGVSYCPICDGNFFKGLVVAVIGSGYEAASDVLLMSRIASEVIMISSKKEIEISKELKERLEEKKNLQITLNAKVESIEGDNSVKSISIVDTKSQNQQRIPVDGVFVSLGRVPRTRMVHESGIEVDESGCIKVDRKQRTNVEGVFAAGDCTCGGMQMVTAAGEGAAAAISASIYTKKTKNY